MEVTDFDPRDIRIRRYQVREPQPSMGGNAGLREMLLKTMLALPAAEIERRAQEAEAERARRFQADEAENNRLFGAAESARERQARGEEAKAGRDFDKPYRDAELELKRDELRNKPNPMNEKIAELSLAAAVDSGDAEKVRVLAPDASPTQVQSLMSNARNEGDTELTKPGVAESLESRISGLAENEITDQPSALQNWQKGHEFADRLLSGYPESDTKKQIRERLKKRWVDKISVKFPGALDEYASFFDYKNRNSGYAGSRPLGGG